MAFIAVNELNVTGAELFQDSESYLNDLNNLDQNIQGGQVLAYGATATIFGLVEKGYEFGVYSIGIEAISHLVKSFSHGYSSHG